MFDFKKLVLSFKYAITGIKTAFKKEQSFRLMLLAVFFVLGLSFILGLNNFAKAILVLSCGFVLGLELLNSQIEKILDIVQPCLDSRVKHIKDLSAGAVLIASITALVVAIFLFLPHLL
ncbi:diacylglycerol kinase [bacterium (Candidatus Gribaldobacteria) CG23_combo_of_CG06-09_8_20_14_all_37_87_8]|uniref:Diacylglycerol kinase n=2 Tax=Candidatus Gribaldobacteria TaxID=2798536 RepID=A0A2G9ZEC0_9BACT|nr:MAG: hypothetical protein AUJ25_01165 [Parcubacteria group bacterium CG1_02_37_13]PIP31525.1 MAG: diacylglycerol kinase [bacterium (Candidatus Gribaldobacteria) CG23_combo_of_CG06-09_8_20_14_all_37_87_8]PIR90752.1 MAG: diacylglycerol kinase [bacterium (Candidatus Gribaldobacteria) CG10_big_fil_rev_8_21_14_0_10_37_21]